MSRDTPPASPELVPIDQLEKHVHIFRLLASPQRLRILDFLDRAGRPQNVTRIVEQCEGVQQAIISQQLRILKDGGVLDSERDGNRIFYRIVSTEVQQYLKFLRESGV